MASHKIAKPAGVPADEIEQTVAQALFDLENNVSELKKELRPLQFSAAKEVSFFSMLAHLGKVERRKLPVGGSMGDGTFMRWAGKKRKKTNVSELDKPHYCFVITLQKIELGGGKKAIVIFVPVPLLKAFHKIQQR
ncbi:hypothetical protein BC937DRAFT_88216 [Endogone sp. FLAS-F59071]|nr:hypothetical protein BC937DRAFT_88216 [Endogone sp. FLAS-F59071]|eukprot:RUS18884.1 hypothetical protein BC937DRAFT_88216 [Endogone sp. FLAS-F59071]